MFAWRNYPLLRLLIPLCIGMGVSSAFQFSNTLCISILAVMLLFAIIAIAMYINSKKDPRTVSAFGFAVFFFVMFFGMEHMLINSKSGDNKYGIYKHNRFQIEKAIEWQESLHSTYTEYGIGGETGAVIEAMTIGRKTEIAKDVKDSFSNSGISYLLAISGYHITFVFLFLQVLLISKISSIWWKRISNILIMLALWAYAFMTGMQPSIIRAVIMCTIMIWSNFSIRKIDILSSCTLAAVIILLVDPQMLYHIGFQLSFVSMIGIHFIALPLINKYSKPLLATLIFSATCSLYTFPLVAYYFHAIPTLGIVASLVGNIITIPLMYLTALWWIVAAFASSIAGFLSPIILFLANALIYTARFISDIPLSTIKYSPSLLDVAILYFLIYKLTQSIYKIVYYYEIQGKKSTSEAFNSNN